MKVVSVSYRDKERKCVFCEGLTPPEISKFLKGAFGLEDDSRILGLFCPQSQEVHTLAAISKNPARLPPWATLVVQNSGSGSSRKVAPQPAVNVHVHLGDNHQELRLPIGVREEYLRQTLSAIFPGLPGEDILGFRILGADDWREVFSLATVCDDPSILQQFPHVEIVLLDDPNDLQNEYDQQYQDYIDQYALVPTDQDEYDYEEPQDEYGEDYPYGYDQQGNYPLIQDNSALEMSQDEAQAIEALIVAKDPRVVAAYQAYPGISRLVDAFIRIIRHITPSPDEEEREALDYEPEPRSSPAKLTWQGSAEDGYDEYVPAQPIYDDEYYGDEYGLSDDQYGQYEQYDPNDQYYNEYGDYYDDQYYDDQYQDQQYQDYVDQQQYQQQYDDQYDDQYGYVDEDGNPYPAEFVDQYHESQGWYPEYPQNEDEYGDYGNQLDDYAQEYDDEDAYELYRQDEEDYEESSQEARSARIAQAYQDYEDYQNGAYYPGPPRQAWGEDQEQDEEYDNVNGGGYEASTQTPYDDEAMLEDVLYSTVRWMAKKSLISSEEEQWLCGLVDTHDQLVLWALQQTNSLDDLIGALMQIVQKRQANEAAEYDQDGDEYGSTDQFGNPYRDEYASTDEDEYHGQYSEDAVPYNQEDYGEDYGEDEYQPRNSSNYDFEDEGDEGEGDEGEGDEDAQNLKKMEIEVKYRCLQHTESMVERGLLDVSDAHLLARFIHRGHPGSFSIFAQFARTGDEQMLVENIYQLLYTEAAANGDEGDEDEQFDADQQFDEEEDEDEDDMDAYEAYSRRQHGGARQDYEDDQYEDDKEDDEDEDEDQAEDEDQDQEEDEDEDEEDQVDAEDQEGDVEDGSDVDEDLLLGIFQKLYNQSRLPQPQVQAIIALITQGDGEVIRAIEQYLRHQDWDKLLNTFLALIDEDEAEENTEDDQQEEVQAESNKTEEQVNMHMHLKHQILQMRQKVLTQRQFFEEKRLALEKYRMAQKQLRMLQGLPADDKEDEKTNHLREILGRTSQQLQELDTLLKGQLSELENLQPEELDMSANQVREAMDMVARAYGDLASLGEGDEGDNDQDEEQDEEQDADEEQDQEQDEEDEDYLARYAEQRQSVDQEDEEEEEEEDEANGQVEEEDSDAAEMESLKQLVAMLSQEHHHGKISKGQAQSIQKLIDDVDPAFCAAFFDYQQHRSYERFRDTLLIEIGGEAPQAAAEEGEDEQDEAAPEEAQVKFALDVIKLLESGDYLQPDQVNTLESILKEDDADGRSHQKHLLLSAFESLSQEGDYTQLFSSLMSVLEGSDLAVDDSDKRTDVLVKHQGLFYRLLRQLHSEDKALSQEEASLLVDMFDSGDKMIAAAFEVYQIDENEDELMETLTLLAQQSAEREAAREAYSESD